MEVPFLSIDVRVWIPTTATCEEYNNSTAQVDTTSSNDVDRRNRGCMFARCWERSSIVIDVGVRLGSSTRYSIGMFLECFFIWSSDFFDFSANF